MNKKIIIMLLVSLFILLLVFPICCSSAYTLKTSVNIPGSGTVSPSDSTYTKGTMVSITAVALEGYIFDHWEGSISGKANPINVVMDSKKEITAVFKNLYDLNIAVDPPGSGSVTPNDGLFTDGDSVQITAIPKTNYIFDYWDGDITGNSNPETININGIKQITAHFTLEPDKCLLGISVFPSDSGTASPQDLGYKPPSEWIYDRGKKTSIVAIGEAGYIFDYWSDDATGEKNHNPSIFMNGSRSITVNFKKVTLNYVGYRDVWIKNLVLNINAKFPQVENSNQDSGFYSEATSVFSPTINLVRESMQNDAVMTIDLTCIALGDRYGGRLLYTGHEVEGTVTLQIEGKKPISFGIQETSNPPQVYSPWPGEKLPLSPGEHRYQAVFQRLLLEACKRLWGNIF